MKDSFSNRLNIALRANNMKATDLVEKTKLSKALISGYMNGKYLARQDKISLIANILDVNEAWLMGYDVPMIDKPAATSSDQDETAKAVELYEWYKNASPETQKAIELLLKPH